MSMRIVVGRLTTKIDSHARLPSNGCTKTYPQADEGPQYRIQVVPLEDVDHVFDSPWSGRTPIGENGCRAEGFFKSYIQPIDPVDADLAETLNAAVNENPIPLTELWDSTTTASIVSEYESDIDQVKAEESQIRAIREEIPFGQEKRDAFVRNEVEEYTLEEWNKIATVCELIWFCEVIEAAIAKHGDEAALRLSY